MSFNLLSQHNDHDGLPVNPTPVHGEAKEPKPPFMYRPLPFGFLCFIATAGVASGINLVSEARHSSAHYAAPADNAEVALINSIRSDGPVFYIRGASGLSYDREYCVRSPIVVDGADGSTVMAGIGREGDHTVVVWLNMAKVGPDSKVEIEDLTWSPTLGAFVTSEFIEVGQVVPMGPGVDC